MIPSSIQVFYVFPDHVNLQVDGVTDPLVLKIRCLQGMWDDDERETPGGQTVDRHADAVDGDRALGDQTAFQFFGETDLDFTGVRPLPDLPDVASGVDVSLNQVSPDPVFQTKRPFQIHPRAFFQEAQVRDAEGFLGKIGLEGVFIPARDRQTTAVDGDAVTDAC